MKTIMTEEYSWTPAASREGEYVGSTRRRPNLDPEQTYEVVIGARTRKIYHSPLFSSWVLERPDKVLPLRISFEQALRLCGK